MTEYKRRIAPAVMAAVVVMNVSSSYAADRPSGTREANCVLRILSPRDSFPINPDVVDRLLSSTPVVGEPLREIVGSTAPSYQEDVSISFEALNVSEQKDYTVLVGIISVEIFGDGSLKSAAEELLAAICERLEHALGEAGNLDISRFHERLGAVNGELEELKQRYQQLRELRRELFEQAGQDDLAHERIIAEIREFEERTGEMRLHLAGAEARENAVAKQIAKIAEQTQQRLSQSPIASQMNNLIKIREQEVEHLRKREQMVGDFEAKEAEEALIHARIQLAQYLESGGNDAGAGLLEKFNRELIESSIEAETNAVELSIMEERLENIRERRLLELADRYRHEVERPLDMLEMMMRDLAQEQYQLKEKLREQRLPEVTVIGG